MGIKEAFLEEAVSVNTPCLAHRASKHTHYPEAKALCSPANSRHLRDSHPQDGSTSTDSVTLETSLLSP